MTLLLRNEMRAYDKDQGQAGVYVPPWVGGLTTVALTANRALFSRFTLSRPMTVVSINWETSVAAGADDAVDVGLYDATLTKIITSGATAGKLNSVGAKSITITATPLLARTVYYAALSSGTQGGTAAAVRVVGWSGNSGDLFGATAGLREACYAATSHPLPTGPVSPAAGLQALPPLFALRES